jgi:hypothetical protein
MLGNHSYPKRTRRTRKKAYTLRDEEEEEETWIPNMSVQVQV